MTGFVFAVGNSNKVVKLCTSEFSKLKMANCFVRVCVFFNFFLKSTGGELYSNQIASFSPHQ